MATDDSLSAVCYRIDAGDVMRSVNQAWVLFAEANGVDTLKPEQVVGCRLWNFIVNEETVTLYKLLLRHVRRTARPVSFPYRCDSPELRRYMLMTVRPLEDNAIEFESVLERFEVRQRSIQRTFAAFGARPLVLCCSCCNKLRIQGRWLEAVEAIQQGEILNTDLPLQVAYAVCGDCKSQFAGLCGPQD